MSDTLDLAFDQLKQAERTVLDAARSAETDGSRALRSAIDDSKVAIWKAMDAVAEACRTSEPK